MNSTLCHVFRGHTSYINIHECKRSHWRQEALSGEGSGGGHSGQGRKVFNHNLTTMVSEWVFVIIIEVLKCALPWITYFRCLLPFLLQNTITNHWPSLTSLPSSFNVTTAETRMSKYLCQCLIRETVNVYHFCVVVVRGELLARLYQIFKSETEINQCLKYSSVSCPLPTYDVYITILCVLTRILRRPDGQ